MTAAIYSSASSATSDGAARRVEGISVRLLSPRIDDCDIHDGVLSSEGAGVSQGRG